MAPIFIPSTLKLSHLKLLAFKCGISTSGTKPLLASRIHDALLHQPTTRHKNPRILSIDMGIRNLAYCILDVPKSTAGGESGITNCSIHAWQRLAVSTAPEALEGGKVVKEAFDPATLSATAYKLLRTRLLPEKPTHILIERQRFRSMGSKHILEWTIRVNMFESILHAVLCTLREEGLWEGEVHAITPGKVGPFWVGEEEDAPADASVKQKSRTSKSAKVRNKGRKIDLVRSWLESGDMVGLGNENVQAVARSYIEKWDRAPGGRKKVELKVGVEKLQKLDDLADCLLQGLAWLQWEENKKIARKHGVEVLLED